MSVARRLVPFAVAMLATACSREIDSTAPTAVPPPQLTPEPTRQELVALAALAELVEVDGRWTHPPTERLRADVARRFGVSFAPGVVPIGYIEWPQRGARRAVTLVFNDYAGPGDRPAPDLGELLLSQAASAVRVAAIEASSAVDTAKVYSDLREGRVFFDFEHFVADGDGGYRPFGKVSGDFVAIGSVRPPSDQHETTLECRAVTGPLAAAEPAMCREDLDGDGRFELWVDEFHPDDRGVAVWRESTDALVSLGSASLIPTWERFEGRWVLVSHPIGETYRPCGHEAGNFQPLPEVLSFDPGGALTRDDALSRARYPVMELPWPKGCVPKHPLQFDTALLPDGSWVRYRRP